MSDSALQRVQDDLRGQLAGQPVEPDPAHQYEPGERPCIRNGVIVPAQSAVKGPAAIYVPVPQVRTVRTTARAVGVYTASGWVVLWIGDDTEERDAVLAAFLSDLGEFSRRKR